MFQLNELLNKEEESIPCRCVMLHVTTLHSATYLAVMFRTSTQRPFLTPRFTRKATNMRTAVATLESISPYSQSRMHAQPKEDKEGADEYEKRTWIYHCHVNKDNRIFIPPMCFKRAIERAASMLGMKIKGKGQATYTKHFLAGILVTDGLVLPYSFPDQIEGETFFMNADGKRGSGKRVPRTYPVFREWKGDVTFYILDETITESIFEKHLQESGNFCGIGRFRPEVGGFYGRYKVNKVQWKS